MPDFTQRRKVFRELHASGCFVIPNPWDVGTARYLQTAGFKALATTSAGFAFSQGLPDAVDAMSREMVLDHIAQIVSATDLPVNADFQNGYAARAEEVAQSVSLCIATGVAGLSIEDSTSDRARPLFELSEAVERVQAARHAIDKSGEDVLLTARAECFLVGHPNPLRESIRRLQAYAQAGADVLFAPGVRDADDLRAIVKSVQPKPVNVLIGFGTPLRVSDLAEMGVRRISVGSALARAAWHGFIRCTKEIAGEGTFNSFADLVSFAELNSVFQK